MGLGKESIFKLCEKLNMPFSISISTWYDHEEVQSKAHEEVVQEQLTREARKQTIEEEGITDADGQTVN